MALHKIMVVIDPTVEQQPAFERALDSARLTGAMLHLYACVNEEASFTSHEHAREILQPTLDAFCTRAGADSVTATGELDWAPDWRREVVAAAGRCGASMVFKSSIDHSAVQRELRSTLDWALLRSSPCPVLLVKNFQSWQHRRILAAINPASADEGHIRLSRDIVTYARGFADSYGSEAHYVTAFQDLNRRPDSEQLAAACGAPAAHIHLKQGRAADVIRDTAKELDVDLIIVGTVGRDGIKGRVIGNTSERLLDQTRSDVLVLN